MSSACVGALLTIARQLQKGNNMQEITRETLYGRYAVQRLWPSGALRVVDLSATDLRSRVFMGYTVKQALREMRSGK